MESDCQWGRGFWKEVMKIPRNGGDGCKVSTVLFQWVNCMVYVNYLSIKSFTKSFLVF